METTFAIVGGSTYEKPEYGVKELAKETLQHKQTESAKAMSGKIGMLSPKPMDVSAFE